MDFSLQEQAKVPNLTSKKKLRGVKEAKKCGSLSSVRFRTYFCHTSEHNAL